MKPQRLPYAGLRPFLREETDIFFGREQHTDQLLARLAQQHFVAVVGYSGCGKSSLVKTGLIASLQAGFLSSAGNHWCIAEMRPGNQPFLQLANALASAENLGDAYPKQTLKAEILKRGPFSLHELFAVNPLPKRSKLLIVCDQFEEIFRYRDQGDSAEAEAFVALLLASSAAYPLPNGDISQDIYVVVTMRADFLSDCALFTGLAEAINNGLYLTPRLNREQLRLAIEEPAFVFGGEIEPALVMRLLNDAGNNPDQLPLLQHALMLMWLLAKATQSSRQQLHLTRAHYQEIGGLEQALSKHADTIFSELEPEQQRLGETLFKALCERGENQRDTRRPQKLATLIELTGATEEELIEVIDIFRAFGCCFLVPPLPIVLNSESVIDISHESLIRRWQRLKTWTEEEAESVKNYLRLCDRAEQRDAKKAGLLQQPELMFFLHWYQQKQPTIFWAKRFGKNFAQAENFLKDSESAYQQQTLSIKRQRYMQAGILVTVIMLVLSYAAANFKNQTLNRVNTELTQSIAENHQKEQQLLRAKLELERMVKKLQEKEQQYQTTISALNKYVPNKHTLSKVYGELNDPGLWLKQANLYLKQKNFKKAIESYEKVVSLNPNDKWAWYRLGYIYKKQGDDNKAIDYFKQQIVVNENHQYAWYHLSLIYEKQQKIVEAIAACRKAMSIDPKSKWVCLQ